MKATVVWSLVKIVEEKMKSILSIICCSIALGWLHGAAAGEVTVSEQDGSIVLTTEAKTDAAQPVSAPAQAGTVNPPMASGSQPEQNAAPVTRVPVKAYYDKVDRANIEKRIADRAARTKKRSMDAEKDAAERAAKVQMNPPAQQEQNPQ